MYDLDGFAILAHDPTWNPEFCDQCNRLADDCPRHGSLARATYNPGGA